MRFSLISVFLIGAMYIITAIINYPTHQKHEKFINEGKELIHDKSGEIYLSESVNISNNDIYGHLNTSATIYKDSVTNKYYLYAWIWSISLVIDSSKSIIRLRQAENIRIASNRVIIGELKSGFEGQLIFTNQLKSWSLCKFPFIIDSQALVHKKPSNIFSGHPPYLTITTTTGGDYYDDSTPEVESLISLFSFIAKHLIWFIVFVIIILLITIKYIKNRNKIKKKHYR